MCFEDIPTDSMMLPIFRLIKDLGYRQYVDPNRSLYGTFGLPRKTVILDIDGEQYHIANTLKMVELVRSGCDVIGISQMVHPNWDPLSETIDVPIRYCAPIRHTREYRVFKTETMPNGFYDPTKPYISVKKVIDPILGSFITEALRS